jgi:hypothetical protein
MTIDDALARLVQSALPLLRFLDYEKPPHSLDEAIAADLLDAQLSARQAAERLS